MMPKFKSKFLAFAILILIAPSTALGAESSFSFVGGGNATICGVSGEGPSGDPMNFTIDSSTGATQFENYRHITYVATSSTPSSVVGSTVLLLNGSGIYNFTTGSFSNLQFDVKVTDSSDNIVSLATHNFSGSTSAPLSVPIGANDFSGVVLTISISPFCSIDLGSGLSGNMFLVAGFVSGTDLDANVFSCTMFEPPLITDDTGTGEVERLTIGKKSKRTIPVKTPLVDENGFVVTHLDIPASGDGVVRPPVINVLYNSISSGGEIVDESALLNPGIADDDNVFDFDESDQKWIHNLSTKHLTAPGTYTIFMTSGNSDAYTINKDSCTISFEREG